MRLPLWHVAVFYSLNKYTPHFINQTRVKRAGNDADRLIGPRPLIVLRRR